MIKFKYEYHVVGSFVKEGHSGFFHRGITLNCRIKDVGFVRDILEKEFDLGNVVIFNWKLLSFRVRFGG